MRQKLTRWIACRAGWWNTIKRPARHNWGQRPGTEAPIFQCLRCDHRIGF